MSNEYDINDYNRGGFIAFIFSMAFTMVFFIYISFIHPGVDLGELKKMDIKKEAAQEASSETAQ